MADSNHLQILDAGPTAVKKWLDSNPTARLDLIGHGLSNRDFSGWNLARVNFQHATLERVNFSGSVLTGAILNQANLTGADLTNANCQNASFESAVLMDVQLASADFTGADLLRARDIGPDLPKAKSVGARLDDVSLQDFDFSGCEFLQQNAVAFLGALVRLLQKNGNIVYFRTQSVNPKVRINLEQNGFLHSLGLGGNTLEW